jgi:hypothetical protein
MKEKERSRDSPRYTVREKNISWIEVLYKQISTATFWCRLVMHIPLKLGRKSRSQFFGERQKFSTDKILINYVL